MGPRHGDSWRERGNSDSMAAMASQQLSKHLVFVQSENLAGLEVEDQANKSLAAHHPANGTRSSQQHPRERPTLRWRPERDNGIPIFLERLAWAWETPKALFQEKLKPGIPLRRDMGTPVWGVIHSRAGVP